MILDDFVNGLDDFVTMKGIFLIPLQQISEQPTN